MSNKLIKSKANLAGLPAPRRSLGRGFTLIELLIVIAVIAILAGVVFVSLDPLSRFRDARDAARYTDVTAILSAIKVDQVDNKGSYLSTLNGAGVLDNKNYMIGTDATGCDYVAASSCKVETEDACLDLAGSGSTGLVAEGYLGKMPINPTGNGISGVDWDAGQTGYYVRKNANRSISVGSCDTESTSAIEVTR